MFWKMMLAEWAFAAAAVPAMAIQPGDDFFAYANADWLQATEIPAGKQRWGARNEIDEQTRQQVQKLLEMHAPPRAPRARSPISAAYLDGPRSGRRTSHPSAALPHRPGGNKAGSRLLGSGLCADVDPLN